MIATESNIVHYTFGGAYGAAFGALDLGVGIWSGSSITDRIGAGIDYSMGAPKLPK